MIAKMGTKHFRPMVERWRWLEPTFAPIIQFRTMNFFVVAPASSDGAADELGRVVRLPANSLFVGLTMTAHGGSGSVLCSSTSTDVGWHSFGPNDPS